MSRRIRWIMLTSAIILSMPGIVRAQGLGPAPAMPNLGSMMGATGQKGPPLTDPSLSINDTFVSFIDSAVPRTVVGLRFDGAYGIRQPTRAPMQ